MTIEKMKEWLEAMEKSLPRLAPYGEQDWLDSKAAITSLRQAIAELESQEPVAWMYDDDYQRMLTSETFCNVWSLKVGSAERGVTTVALFARPPQRTEQKPRGYQWFDTAVFEKELPENSNPKEWNALFTRPEQMFVGTVKELFNNTAWEKLNVRGSTKVFIDAMELPHSANLTEQPEQEPQSVRERWNIERDGDDLLVCFNDHDKSQACTYARYVPAPQRKPIQNLQCFHCQDTIETLNDKVMQLMAKRTWVGLTDVEVHSLAFDVRHGGIIDFSKAIEAKLKQKNGYAEENT